MKCNEAVEFGECAYEFQSNSSAVGFNGLSICAPQKIWLRVLQLGHEKGVLMTRVTVYQAGLLQKFSDRILQ